MTNSADLNWYNGIFMKNNDKDLQERWKRMMNMVEESSVRIGHQPQEPERDEQGTMYGYKMLGISDDGTFLSPVFVVEWSISGELTSDGEPSEYDMRGIYFTKRKDSLELTKYPNVKGNPYILTSLVRCALSGTVVETEYGFRAQHARIIEVLIDGHWESYQDTYERARRNSRRNSFEKDYRAYPCRGLADSQRGRSRNS